MNKQRFQPGDRLLTWHQLKEEMGIPYSRQHVYRMMDAGTFPKAIKLSARRIAWVESVVRNWLSERM